MGYIFLYTSKLNKLYLFFFLAMPLACGMLVPHLGIGLGSGNERADGVLTTESSGNSQKCTLQICAVSFMSPIP